MFVYYLISACEDGPSVQAPSLMAQIQSGSLLSEAWLLVSFPPPMWRKGRNAVVAHKVMAPQTLLEWKQHRSCLHVPSHHLQKPRPTNSNASLTQRARGMQENVVANSQCAQVKFTVRVMTEMHSDTS